MYKSYHIPWTAWTMLHRFRRAMVRPERAKLRGLVEVDETYPAITDRPSRPSRQRKNRTAKAQIALAVEIHEPKGFGGIRLQRIDDDSSASMIPFVQRLIEPAAQVRTNGSAAYRDLPALGYEHARKVMLGAGEPAHVSMPGVHRVASLIKRWCWARTKGRLPPSSSTSIWTSSCFASIAERRVREGCSSTG